jgi:hypothetical protein
MLKVDVYSLKNSRLIPFQRGGGGRGGGAMSLLPRYSIPTVAKSMLPLCTNGREQWQRLVVLENKPNNIRVALSTMFISGGRYFIGSRSNNRSGDAMEGLEIEGLEREGLKERTGSICGLLFTTYSCWRR